MSATSPIALDFFLPSPHYGRACVWRVSCVEVGAFFIQYNVQTKINYDKEQGTIVSYNLFFNNTKIRTNMKE